MFCLLSKRGDFVDSGFCGLENGVILISRRDLKVRLWVEI